MNDTAKPASAIVAQLSDVRTLINELAETVYRQVVHERKDEPWGLSDPELVAERVKAELGKPGANVLRQHADLLLSSAEFLMKSPQEAGNKDALLAWCQKPSTTSTGETEKIRIELLTTCWLGLHFLGVPVSNPWERVRRWADEEGGGLPNGACVAKAIGDIVRDARRFNESIGHAAVADVSADSVTSKDVGSANPAANEQAAVPLAEAQKDEAASARSAFKDRPLIVFSGLPLLLFPELLRGPPRDACTPNGAHMLGRIYEFLQLVNYLRAKYQIFYCVKEDIVVQCLRFVLGERKKELTQASAFEAWARALDWLHTLMPEPKLDRQTVCVLEDPLMPACFINYECGLYTVETPMFDEERSRQGASEREMPLPASYMREIRRLLYIENLQLGGGAESAENLLRRSADHHQEVFARIWSRFPSGRANA